MSSSDSECFDFSSDEEIEDLFEENEDFEGFVYRLPDNIKFVKDEDGSLTQRFYERNPHTAFSRADCGPAIDEKPGEGKAIDYFELFFPDELFENIKLWTNRWVELKAVENFSAISEIEEIKAYFALLLAMNKDVNLPRYENYFRQDERKWLYLVPGFSRVFTLHRFQHLNRYICFADPDELNLVDMARVTENDKLAKVRPFIETMQKGFQENFNCGKAIAIDECMVPYKGRLSIKQRMTAKPVKWGVKLFELCDSETSYLYRFEVYLGKERNQQAQTPSAIGKSGEVVTQLTNGLEGKGHNLYIDNWYTSVGLTHLLQAKGIYVCGTVRPNRKGYPAELKTLKGSKMARGNSEIRSYNGITALAWKDTKLVHFLSTIHSPEEISTVQRNKRQGQGGYEVAEIQSHAIVNDYNDNMGAVDRNDQLTCIQKSRKQMRWYMRLIVKFLELATYNAYIIEGFFTEHAILGQRKRDFATFREDLILQLVGTWRTERSKPGRKRSLEDPVRLENVGVHLPVKVMGTDHTCEVCREKHRRYMLCNPGVPKQQVPHKLTKTTFKCNGCDAYLCITRENDCFSDWHTKVEYWS
ncbi:hypothetical protein QZH41_006731 [Actinostola sp. cb2023]|nr:hypothetical protein QZH41_006731 [Actinostola sp. cb2023]